MYTQEDDQKDHIKWMKKPCEYSSYPYQQYDGKIVKKICRYGNGEVFIFFVGGKILQFSLNPEDHEGDLYSKTDDEFNFKEWRYREDNEMLTEGY